MSARPNDLISVAYGGVEVTDPNARSQISTTVWAALRKQKYVYGSECLVMVSIGPDGAYEVEANAKEPAYPWQPLLDLVVPTAGYAPAEFEAFLNDMGLAPFVSAPEDALLVGGDSGERHSHVAPKHVAGRNDLCPCGSGKKFKRCCLQ